MELHRVRRRRAAVAIVASALCATVLGLIPPAGATADVKSDRVAGQNRFETAAKVAAAAFPTGAKTVAIASGRTFPDALAGAALGVPVLLTERDTLPAATASAIDALKADDAIILGGTASVSAAVATEIAKHADVSRIAGADRYETAAAIASSLGAAGVGKVGGKATAIIATGLGFADALAGGPLATGGTGAGSLPILLVSSQVPDATSKALDDLGIQQAILLGGTSAVSAAVADDIEQETGSKPVRLAGTNRFGTAATIGDYAIDTLDFAGDVTLLASGQDFADALAGGPLGGVKAAPLLLTDPAQLPDESESFFEDHSDTIDTITTLGGTAAVSTSAAQDAEKAAETPSTGRVNETYAVTPTATANQANGSTREFTATGLGTTVVDIALVPCSYVKTGTDGKTTFANTNANTSADSTADGGSAPDTADTPAFISKVNGEDRQEQDPTINNDYVAGATPAAGKVTFTVTGPSGSATACVIPVVFDDANNGSSLTVPTSNPALPTEAFGTGGATSFSPGGAGLGAFNVNVTTSNDDANYFVGCPVTNTNAGEFPPDPSKPCPTYNYDGDDIFQLNGAAIQGGLTTFETYLTAGDDVTGKYSPDPKGHSTFNLYQDEAPEAPTPAGNSVAQPNPDATCDSTGACSVTIAFTESTRVDVDSYRLYRTLKPGEDACPNFSSTDGSHTLMSPTDSEGVVSSEITDRNASSTPSADSQLSATDHSVAPSTTYCYRLVSVEDGDEGPPTGAIVAATPESNVAGAPLINDATTTKANDAMVALGDTYTIVFSELMDQTAVESATFIASGKSGGTVTVNCGANALCTLGSDDKTLTVRLGPPSTTGSPVYPLTITSTTGFEDLTGNEVSLADSPDKEIGTEAAP